jgi:hypothetical protein
LELRDALLLAAVLVWPVVAGTRYLVDRKSDLLRNPIKWKATSRRLTKMDYQVALNGCDPERPLVFQFTVFQPGNEARYIGHSSDGLASATRSFQAEVHQLLATDLSRPQATVSYQRIHYVLADATRRGWSIELKLLANVADGEDSDALTKQWIKRVDARLNEKAVV